MNWAKVAEPHVGPEHRLTLTDVQHLRCHSCAVTLVLPRDESSPTHIPPRWQMPEDGTPMPGWFRDRVLADIAARRKTEEET